VRLKLFAAWLVATALAMACSWGAPARPDDATNGGSTSSGGSSFPPAGDGSGLDPLDASPNSGAIVLIADGPSHGPREHEYRAGTLLLQAMLEQSPGVVARVLPAFPDDLTPLRGARAIILMTSGAEAHPLLVGKRADLLDFQLRQQQQPIGFAAIHFSTYPLEPLTPRLITWAGGAFGPQSIYAEWDASFDTLPSHPITQGVAPFSVRDEIYYRIQFSDAGAVTPILRAAHPSNEAGQTETVAWTWERAGGGRSFSYTGMHYHDRWAMDPLRRLIVNAILWVAGYDVPEAGAPIAMDAALINQNLDPK